MHKIQAVEAEIAALRRALETTAMTSAKEAEVRAMVAQKEAELAEARHNAAAGRSAATASAPRSGAEIEVEIRTLRWVLATIAIPHSEAAKLHDRIAEINAQLGALRSTVEVLRPGSNDDDEDDGPRRGGGYPSTTGRPSGGGRWND